MDVSSIASRLGLVGSGSGSKTLIRKAEELRRLSDLRFDSAAIGVGEVCKAIICLEIAATRMNVLFDRQSAIKMSGMSEKAYTRSFNMMQNGLGIKASLDVRELAIQFGCVRLIPFVNKGLALYKERFLDALPASRRATTDFNRPVFTVVAFYLCAKRHKLKADKLKLIELCGTSESEFATVSTSMKDLCYDAFGISKEKKDPKAVKQHRELLDALPGKRSRETDGDLSDTSSADNEDALVLEAQLFPTLTFIHWKWYWKGLLKGRTNIDEWKKKIQIVDPKILVSLAGSLKLNKIICPKY
ncbi:origin of replication complex subunit 6-like isoform X1 [Iris pallida]|uniref:Origin of replication complex subunit 6 n=1 Tax=Iris pallida TaxID=29817 RepID=A0AAX6EB92_IRIPA|nr:origin of replication complex subunit 6-like isoform X1 [Iris pallida]